MTQYDAGMTQQIDTTDQEINLRVYRLYGLTYEEVQTVDPETKITREEYEGSVK